MWTPLLWAALILAAALHAQAPPTASVDGRVTDAQTGDPLRKAQVILRHWRQARGQGAYGATTDAAGRYVIDGIEPGIYGVSASRNAYISGRYGQKKAAGPGTPLTLTKGQHAHDVSVRLFPQAVVSGAVLDDDNEGILGVSVTLVAQRYDAGRRVLYDAGSDETDDRGLYRITGVSAGRYYLVAVYHGQNSDQQSEVLNETLGSYVPVYYPDSLGGPAAASQITATAGAEIAGMDFHLRRVHLAHISGRILNGPRAGDRRATVTLMSQEAGELSWAMNKDQMTDGEGRFVFHDCAPGEYILMAQFFAGKEQLSGMVQVSVNGSNADGLNLNLVHLPNISGQLKTEGSDVKAFTAMTVYLEPLIPLGNVPVPRATPAADGSFELQTVGPNRYRVLLVQMPESAYLKSVRAGGVEATDGVLDFRKGAAPDLTVVISGRGAQLTGKVRNGATVLLAPDRRDRYDLYKSETADQNGAYTLKGVAPGRYKLFAFDQVESSAWEDPDFLTPYEKNAQPIEFHEGDHVTKDPDVIVTPP